MKGGDGVGGWGVSQPRVLRVGVTVGGVAGGGHLYISPDHLVCEMGAVTRRLAGIERVRHEGRKVHVYRSLLVPCWFNVAVRVDDGQQAARASVSWFQLRHLVRVLVGAGFSVQLHKTWLFRGLTYAEMTHRL